MDDTTCLIERSAVRTLLIEAAEVNNDVTTELLADVDRLPIVTLADAERAAERLGNLVDRLKLEARCHAQEARGANHTIAEAYQAVTQGKGEPGNWNGARPVIEELQRLRVGWRTDWDEAPRDGTDILIGGRQHINGTTFDRSVVAAWDVEEVGGDGGWATDNGLEPIDFVPEFWMPIPALPIQP